MVTQYMRTVHTLTLTLDRFRRHLSIQHLHLHRTFYLQYVIESWFGQFHENALHEYRALKARAHKYKYTPAKRNKHIHAARKMHSIMTKSSKNKPDNLLMYLICVSMCAGT